MLLQGGQLVVFFQPGAEGGHFLLGQAVVEGVGLLHGLGGQEFLVQRRILIRLVRFRLLI